MGQPIETHEEIRGTRSQDGGFWGVAMALEDFVDVYLHGLSDAAF
jgi:hypothetical protein